ncbi:MAG TPA: hypothetical protein PKD86_16065 [Gemmatales bacterium]|mgnify:CR=1 FL=1|nr:hypothetical protein [Gemmatales bacterium]HMP60861.1 hypothetical protein [Gemmatales bacterium]
MSPSVMMMERMNMAAPGVGSMPATPVNPTGNMVMVPRCTVRMEKCTGGVRMHCTTEDPASVAMLQHLCYALAGGMVSCVMTMNGMEVCVCRFPMGMCRCEMTETGVCITCTSGDTQCCAMIQACADCCVVMMTNGCTCCVMMGGSPVCMSVCESMVPTSTSAMPKRK